MKSGTPGFYLQTSGLRDVWDSRLRTLVLERNPTKGLRMEYEQQSRILRNGKKLGEKVVGNLRAWVRVKAVRAFPQIPGKGPTMLPPALPEPAL